ncbi:hypothetical protein BGZ95_003713 [Linnemannia exigua]|uniref:Uncharacterized protein n=1 Tax=Linnemannia exigua TaxID=604196 RepID=A0AAD4D603_9FUNG|nr:hypothetical protein BGZ95_003713 [Linnemannia exigua]
MDSACSTFFSIPELVTSVTPYLSSQDIIQLSRTTRGIRSICSPLTWQSVNLGTRTTCIRLLESPEALQAFGNHISSIRSITMRPKFSCYYLYSVWAYLNITAWPAHRAISIDALAHKEWGGMLYAPCLKILPLPPMLRLTRFVADLSSSSGDRMQPELPAYNHDKHLHQILWLVRLSRNTLTYLELCGISVGPRQLARDIARTLSELHQLRTLKMITYISRCEFETFFLSCQGSLVDFKAAFKLSGSGTNDFHHPRKGDWDFSQGPLVLRQTPLPHLKQLFIPDMTHQDMPLAIRSLLEHTPALESLSFPFFQYDEKPICKVTNELCPRLSELTFRNGGWSTLGPMIRDAIPVQQMRSLYCFNIDDPDIKAMTDTWTKHSTTLQRIEFLQANRISSQVIQAALRTCEALEVFKIASQKEEGGISLFLEHAAGCEWVCKRMRVLEITVLIEPKAKSLKYLDDPTKETWTEDEHRHWENLGKFYTQIGSLTELEILDLKTVERFSERGEPSTKYFPGLFALEDVGKGEIGYLSKWAGLVKLRELRGSVKWTVPLVMERIGKREVDWFVDHMPALRMATFVLQNNNGLIGAGPIRGYLRNLEKKRPELKFSHKA